MKRRQDLESEHPELFCEAGFVERLLADFAVDLKQAMAV